MSLKNEKEKAIHLRRQGQSYSQILKKLNLKSKGTLSSWFRDLELSEVSQEKLRRNRDLAVKRGLHEFNEKRSRRIKDENEEAKQKGVKEIQIRSNHDLLILGAALYWGEGTKYEGASPSLIFTNSDPTMIEAYMYFLRNGLRVQESAIKAGIHVHSNVGVQTSKKFWSKTTQLPEGIFYIVSLTSRASSGKREKTKLPYGTMVIKVNRRKVFYRVKGMVESLKMNDWKGV